MSGFTSLGNARARASASDADIVERLLYWSEDCRRRGLCAEGMVMFDAMTEIELLRGLMAPAPASGLNRSVKL